MMNLISKDTARRLLSFSVGKKVAFLTLLYERMVPDLRSFCLSEGRDLSVFEKSRSEYWAYLASKSEGISWAKIREDILDATPDSEDFGYQEASFAINAALVAADIAGLLVDGQDAHLKEAMGYALNSLSAFAIDEIGVTAYDRAIANVIKTHPLLEREARTEEEDVAFLSIMQDPPWPKNILSTVQHRAETQSGLLC
ncbi:DUF416 family protein [Nitrospirillum sp. BR 11163]|uniref:DUF416 family protein n=1 Tax=Nitrospirillum sp. BR 11163 TaxID=3104323 RepID=UPI002AFFE3CE|nr:DUF416 family protein [Nitrospirillum sp. BR 11163]MEA1677475.1 DUF416 family protein [Nitrospirillum sp. BR 11163]